MKKRLIALMIATLMSTTTAGCLTGCSKEKEKENTLSTETTVAFTIEDVLISVELKDGYILHKGDIVYYESGFGKYATGNDLKQMNFDCGKSINTNAAYIVSKEAIDEDCYDAICEDCFSNNN